MSTGDDGFTGYMPRSGITRTQQWTARAVMGTVLVGGGALVGGAIGGIIGWIAGGPAGAYAGAKVGAGVGAAAGAGLTALLWGK